MKPELTLERFLEVFVPGVLIAVGTWYLHRPLLATYFPLVASDLSLLDDITTALGGKAFVFSVIAVTLGLICNHLSDIAIVGLVDDKCESPKARRRDRALFRIMMRPFVFKPSPDPRIVHVNRYMESPRSQTFISMLRDWTGTDAEALRKPDASVTAHQHILTHLLVVSQDIRAIVTDMYRPVSISASLFAASALLLPISLLSFLSRSFVIGRAAVLPVGFHIVASITIYGFAILAGYSLRRRYRHYCAQVLTLGLHAYIKEKGLNEMGGQQTPLVDDYVAREA